MGYELSFFLSGLFDPFINPLSRTHWIGLVATLVVTGFYYFLVRPSSWTRADLMKVLKHPSIWLDLQLLISRQLLRMLIGSTSLLSGWLVATRGVRWLDQSLGTPEFTLVPGVGVAILYTVVLFVSWDLSRFILHFLMHKIPFLWAFHQVHHSAEVITPLTHHRIHPFESWLYDMRGALVTGVVAGGFYWLFRGAVSDYTLLGVPALGFICNVTTGNLRHSHVWLRFPPVVERWFISPAQHQLHHSLEPAHHGSNYGTWLAIWDRAFGVLIISDKAPVSFGIPVSERNHGDDLLSAWFGPMRGALLPLIVVFSLTVGGMARAQDLSPADLVEEEQRSDEDWTGFGEEIFVDGDQEAPREAGSAYVVDEAALELFEYDDIERVLATVPGVSTRGEDGYGLRPNIGIRGANSDRSSKITLMEDGILLAPAPYAAPAAYYFPMSTRFVGVEVFKGAAATRYGPQTVGGAINVLTRSIPEEAEAYGDLSIGLRHSYKAHAWSGLTHKRVGVLVEGVHLRSGGFKELDSGGPTGFARTEFMVKSSLEMSPVHRLRLKLGYANETSHETYLGLSQHDWESTPLRRYAATEKALMEWDRTQAVLEWLVRKSPDFKVRTVVYHHYLNRSWTKLNGFGDSMDLHELLQIDPDSGQGAVYLAILRGEEDSSGGGQNLLIGTNDRQFQSFGVQSTLRWESFGERLGSSFEAGLRLHGDDVKRLHTQDPFAMQGGRLVATDLSTETILDSHAGVLALAGYVHEDLSLDRMHLFPSGRVEVVRGWREDEGEEPSPAITRPALLPGLGGLYELGDWTDAFLSAHRGFSPVSPGQSLEVKPEYSWNYEAGLRHNLGGYRAELVGYFNDYQNLTGECTMSSGCDSDNLGRQYNGGRVSIYGLESVGGLTIPLSPGVSLPIEATYTLTESQFQTDFVSGLSQFGSVQQGDSLPYVARHSASFRAGLETKRLTLSAGVSYRSQLLDSAGSFTDDDEVLLPELLLIDAGGNLALTDGWSLYMTGTNLTNTTAVTSWRPWGARPSAPLQVMAGIKWRPQP